MKTVYRIIIVVVVVLLFIGYEVYRTGQKDKQVQQLKQQAFSTAINQLKTNPSQNSNSAGKLVEGFPAELVLDKTATLGTGQVNSNGSITQEFYTTKSIQEEYNLYLNYFQSNGWKITTNNYDEQHAFLLVNKGSDAVDFRMTNYDNYPGQPKGTKQFGVGVHIPTK